MRFEESGCIKVEEPNECLIYFLLDHGEVVYVGQTRVGVSRVTQHTDKQHDEAYVMPCSRSDLDLLENVYIWKYMPKYNKQPNNVESVSIARMKRALKDAMSAAGDNRYVTVLNIKRAIKLLGVETRTLNGVVYVDASDVEPIIDCVMRGDA